MKTLVPKRKGARNQDQLATDMGVSIRTLVSWIAEGLPLKKDKKTGEYNTNECIAWIGGRDAASRKRPVGRSRLDGTSPIQAHGDDRVALVIAKLEAEVAKLKQEARGKSLKNDEYEGLLLPADDVRQWIASRFLRIKSRLEQLPEELQLLAPSSLRPQLHSDLSNAIHDLLLEMSGWEVQSQKTDLSEE